MTSMFFYLISLIFPFCCYFIYLFYSKVTYEKERMIFFDLALFSSLYLGIRFEYYSLLTAFLINIPLFLALKKERYLSSFIISLGISFFFSDLYKVDVLIFFMIYLLIHILKFILKTNLINLFVLINGIFLSTLSIFMPSGYINQENFLYVIFILILMYITLYFLNLFYNKNEQVVNMFYSLEEITKEKTLYQSLFKITHEIKNPLAVCKGYLDMFDIKNPSKANKYVGIIDQEIDRTLELLKDFSDVSKLKIEKDKMDANMLLEDVCDETKMILQKEIDFDYKLLNKEVYIYADYNRLKQVFINVIKNAKEAVGENGFIKLSAKVTKGKLNVIIEDNGKGMDKETSKKIGTPFYTTKKNGTGLGVCFSREIIEKHSGKIEYFSKEGKGTTVKIVLPLEKTSII